ncbi:unnamed protein product [Effrenium voratum]|nr:unnamed protein product [Effrenium voratum]
MAMRRVILLAILILPQGVAGALSLPVYQSLEWLVLSIRQSLMKSAWEDAGLPAPDVKSLKQYSPQVQDDSLCSSTQGPHCRLVGGSAPPVVADGAVQEAVRLTLLKSGSVPAMQFAKATRVSCGAHEAETCAECPQGRGEQWCHGECEWRNDFCVAKGAGQEDLRKPQEDVSVSCGQHRAPSCSACPQDHGAQWCNGDCVWNLGKRQLHQIKTVLGSQFLT